MPSKNRKQFPGSVIVYATTRNSADEELRMNSRRRVAGKCPLTIPCAVDITEAVPINDHSRRHPIRPIPS